MRISFTIEGIIESDSDDEATVILETKLREVGATEIETTVAEELTEDEEEEEEEEEEK